MSTSVKFMKSEAGMQTAFDTAATTNFKLPWTGEYEDLQEDHAAEYDAGTWTPNTIAAKVANYAALRFSGTAFYEYMPVIHNLAWTATGPTDQTTYQQYDASVSVSAVGAPRPYTFLLGGKELLGATGPAVKIQDAYCQSYTLSGGINEKAIQLTAELFGLSVNDNAAAGFAFADSALFSPVGMMKSLTAVVKYKTAGTTGGSFVTMNPLSCVLLDWQMTFNTGLMPKWAADQADLSYCGVRHAAPSIEIATTIRTDATTYAAIKAKADARTFQEIEFFWTGDDQRALKYQFTGRFLPNFIAHSRSEDEVVMQPTFRVETPHTQTTTPHWFGWQLDTEYSHALAV